MSDSIVPNSAEDNRSNRQVSLRQLGEQLMPQQAFCSALELVINKALNLTLNGQEPLNKLEQKTLAITLAELGFTLCFTVSNSKVLEIGRAHV